MKNLRTFLTVAALGLGSFMIADSASAQRTWCPRCDSDYGQSNQPDYIIDHPSGAYCCYITP